MTLLPDFFVVTIYNMSPEDMTSITLSKTLSVYGKDMGLLVTGEIDDVYEKQEDVDRMTIISLVDGKSFWHTKVNKSLGGGTTVKKTINSLIQNANIGAFTADDVRLIRGQTYCGRLAECVSMLARSVHGRAYITNGTVFVTAKGRASEVVTLDDGEIIMSQKSSTGARIISTLVKGYPVGALIEINGNQYRLVSQKFDADNYEGTWDCYMVLINEDELSFGGMEGG